MVKKLALLVVILVVALSLVSLIGCASSAPSTPPTTSTAPSTSTAPPATAAAKTLTIGMTTEMSGVISPFAVPASVGTKVALQYINDHGGVTVKGQKYNLDLYWSDNKSTADGATASATDILSRGIKLVIGGIPTYSTVAITAVTSQNGQFYSPIYHVGTKQEYDPSVSSLKYFFNPGSIEDGAAVIAYMHKQHPEVKKVTFSLVEAGDYTDILNKYKTITSNLGISIIEPVVTASDQITDVTPVAQKIISQNPDAVALGDGYYQLYVLKSLREMGYTKPVMLCSLVDPISAQSVAGPQASTNFYGAGISENATDMPPVMKEVAPMIAAASDDHHFTFSRAYYFNGLYALANVIQAANSIDPKDIAAYLDSLGDTGTVKTIFGDAKLGGAQTYGLKHVLQQPIPIETLDNNVLKDVGWSTNNLP